MTHTHTLYTLKLSSAPFLLSLAHPPLPPDVQPGRLRWRKLLVMCSLGARNAGSTFLGVIPPHRGVGGDDELCALGVRAAVVR